MKFKSETELAKKLGISVESLQSRITPRPHKKDLVKNKELSPARKKLAAAAATINFTSFPIEDPQVILYRALMQRYGSYWSNGEMVYELRGVIPGRRFELDMAIPRYKIGIEMDGYRNHGLSKSGFNRDRKKWMAMQKVGWMVIPVSPEQVREQLAETIDSIHICKQGRSYADVRVEMKRAVIGCTLIRN